MSVFSSPVSSLKDGWSSDGFMITSICLPSVWLNWASLGVDGQLVYAMLQSDFGGGRTLVCVRDSQNPCFSVVSSIRNLLLNFQDIAHLKLCKDNLHKSGLQSYSHIPRHD